MTDTDAPKTAPTASTTPTDRWDLCAGPHVGKTSDINMDAVALESVAGAYWRGDEKRPMLQRVYGTAWERPEQLQAYIHLKVGGCWGLVKA